MPEKAKFGEQVVNKFIEMVLARIVNAERISVRVKAGFKKLARGELDALTIEMYGFSLRKHLRVDEFQFNIGASAVDLGSIKQRQIQLLHPSNGSLRVIISQEQLNTALNAQLLEPSEIYRQLQVKCQLGTDNKIAFYFNWMCGEEIQSGSFTTKSRIEAKGNAVVLDRGDVEGTEPPIEFVNTVMAQLSDILSLSDIADRGTSFDFQQLNVEGDRIIVEAATHISQFPAG